jgi:hypothetical protein
MKGARPGSQGLQLRLHGESAAMADSSFSSDEEERADDILSLLGSE